MYNTEDGILRTLGDDAYAADRIILIPSEEPVQNNAGPAPLMAKLGAVNTAVSDEIEVVQLSGMGVDEAIQYYSSMGITAEPDYRVYALTTPNDPSYSQQWGLKKISAPAAWDIATGFSNIVAAVIDTGVDLDHPDLIDNLWTNRGEIPNNGIDDDGNGYIDDVHGWNFVANTANTDDDNEHGTHCAGIIGAAANNGLGVSGVSWDVSIMPVKVLDSAGNGYTSNVINGIRYAVENGADIISLSLGSAYDSLSEKTVIESFPDVLFVIAAGNDGKKTVNYPAAYAAEFDHVMAVASTTSSDSLSSFSNYGKGVTVAAPGSDIYSTVPSGSYASMSGTSMAAPLVAGSAALMKSVDSSLTPSEIKSMIVSTADRFSIFYSFGRLNLASALKSVEPADDRYVSEIYFSIGSEESSAKEALTSAGYKVIDVDLNKGAGGKYIYLGYKTTTNPDNAIRGIVSQYSSKANNAASVTYNGNQYYAVGANGYSVLDVNKEAGGKYIYVYATKSASAGKPITSLDVSARIISSIPDSFSNWNVVKSITDGKKADLNKGAGGKYIYLYYK